MIPQRNLSLLSNRLARAGGRRVVEAVLERDYCLAWFLVGLSRSPLREALVFKGGGDRLQRLSRSLRRDLLGALLIVRGHVAPSGVVSDRSRHGPRTWGFALS